MNKKQKMTKKLAKRAKAKFNKHTPPTVKKYVSKAERAKNALEQQQTAESAPTESNTSSAVDEATQ